MASITTYNANFSSADVYDAEANAAYFWSSASPAFHDNYHQRGYYQNYSDYSEMQGHPAGCYWAPAPAVSASKQSFLPCGLSLDDYSDFSSDDESQSSTQPSTPDAASKALRTKSHSIDDIASTDAASTDASAHASDESGESDNESVGTPKAKGQVYSRDALMLLRIAVGMCAQPPARWATKARDSEQGECEWRRAAELSQQASAKAATAKLAPSATSWVAQQRARVATDAVSDEEVTRSVKSILNKLTVEKFDALYEKLIACGISSESHIEMLVHEVFEKACMQHHFVEMYADLCVRIEAWHEGAGHGHEGGQSFRRILLNQCQCSFEASLKPPALGGNDEEEQMELAAMHKKRVLGNIRLVGALLNRGQLAPRVMLACAEELLTKPSAQEALESLALLLTIVGPKFDDPSWPHHTKLCYIFDRVEGLTKDKAVAPRLRFLLRDLLDLRATTWADMKKVTKKEAGPMKIEEVHRQAAVEAVQPAPAKTPQSSGSPKAGGKSGEKSPKKSSDGMAKQNDAKQSPKNKGSSTPGSEKKETPSAIPAKESRGRRSAPTPQTPATPKASQQAHASTSQPTKSVPATPPGNFHAPAAPFSLSAFHRELTDVMRELGTTRDTMAAVRRMKLQNVPVEHQSSEFSNILTRVAEERCGAVRRLSFAFAASLVGGAFDRQACAKGVKSFLDDVYEDLCEDVPRLPEILKAELVPTLRTSLTAEKFDKLLPASLK